MIEAYHDNERVFLLETDGGPHSIASPSHRGGSTPPPAPDLFRDQRELLLKERKGIILAKPEIEHENLADLMDYAAAAQAESLEAEIQISKLMRIYEIDAALAAIANGTYGVCEECGGSIPASRLKARPEARLCFGCQERIVG